jgi:hypothetical protein
MEAATLRGMLGCMMKADQQDFPNCGGYMVNANPRENHAPNTRRVFTLEEKMSWDRLQRGQTPQFGHLRCCNLSAVHTRFWMTSQAKNLY